MRRRGRGHGNIFGDSGPEESLPEFEFFLHAPSTRRTRSAYRVRSDPRPIYPGTGNHRYRTTRRAAARPSRPWVVGFRVAICAILLVFGLTGLGVGIAQAVGGYSDAARMAGAPSCTAADQAASDAACTLTEVYISPYGTLSGDGEDSIDLAPQGWSDPAGSDYYSELWVSYPGNARFDALIDVGGLDTPVRVEYWIGQIVTLTAGNPGITVTTDANPNNRGGKGVGGALMSFALVIVAVLLFVGIRAVRLRWLRPGIGLRLFVSESIVLGSGAFLAGVCAVNQPALVALVAAVAVPATSGLAGTVWLLVRSDQRARARRRTALGIG
ncbi:hypothetical protein KDK95_24530 [Actinospica sp. MGRD01-02]|uniref:Uncharacterized protein n=1 Tax=Actinospica acidithermotolerans TaxID=2828514 RepID=A0A941EFA4_9ACTN|nr:hypothetical protein [Actinospica acidithermotolerans]MBR7829495.1 hypothetical protein [Actinospica acidithermotolerans]